MLDDNQLKEELSNLSEKEQIRFTKLLETFNHRGGSSSNSKVNRALEVAKYKGPNIVQGGGGLFSGLQTMLGGVSEKMNSVKDFITPNVLKEATKELEDENNANKFEKASTE